VAVAQLNCGEDVAQNVGVIDRLAGEAAAGGAELLALPENATYMGRAEGRLAAAERAGEGATATIAAIARQHEIAILVGSFCELSPEPNKTYNTSALFGPDGSLVATYRKIHLFDVNVAADTRFCESDNIVAGATNPVVAPLGDLRLGLSICYDLRFAELFRALSALGANVLCVPAAFTWRTGAAHWELLLRARAVENFAWLIAPAQWGSHGPGRETWGHAMVVSPWGEVVAQHPEGVGIVFADLTLDAVESARRRIPALQHRRM
jgi:predicted amidohydrolase